MFRILIIALVGLLASISIFANDWGVFPQVGVEYEYKSLRPNSSDDERLILRVVDTALVDGKLGYELKGATRRGDIVKEEKQSLFLVFVDDRISFYTELRRDYQDDEDNKVLSDTYPLSINDTIIQERSDWTCRGNINHRTSRISCDIIETAEDTVMNGFRIPVLTVYEIQSNTEYEEGSNTLDYKYRLLMSEKFGVIKFFMWNKDMDEYEAMGELVAIRYIKED